MWFGGGSSSEETLDSVDAIETSLKSNGFTLEKLSTTSSKLEKVNANELSIAYGVDKKLLLSTDTLYSLTNAENKKIFLSIDTPTNDPIEKSSTLVMEHNLADNVLGFTNINSTINDANVSKESILAEVNTAFKQVTLTNVSTLKTTYTQGEDVNVSYTTDLKNQDETFLCNTESKVIDAQNGRTTLSTLSVGEQNCTMGDEKVLMLSFTVLQGLATTVEITQNIPAAPVRIGTDPNGNPIFAK